APPVASPAALLTSPGDFPSWSIHSGAFLDGGRGRGAARPRLKATPSPQLVPPKARERGFQTGHHLRADVSVGAGLDREAHRGMVPRRNGDLLALRDVATVLRPAR